MSQQEQGAPFLIGINVPTSIDESPDPVSYARLAEQLGFDFISASDHPCSTTPSFETWTMLSWIAAATSKIKVATRVLGVPYRSPAMVAKMAETLDRLSKGRVILGLGGGSADDEFRAFGLNVPSPREKVEGLEDAVRIVRGLWSQASFTHEGKHHRTEAADIEPKPEHHIPIWLGTFGKQSLEVTGRLANGWIPSLSYAPPERIPAMRARISAAAEETGRDPADIAFVYNVEVQIATDDAASSHVVTGSPDVVADRLIDMTHRLGLAGVNLMPVGRGVNEHMQRLGGDLLPRLRQGL